MPVYEYTALDAKGKNTNGIIDADSPYAARQKLRGSRIFPVSVREVKESQAKKESSSVSLSAAFTRVRPSEVALMTRQLATLLGAGFPLVTALDTLIPQTRSQGFKKCLSRIKDSITEGNSFAASLSLYPGVFPPLYINMISAGETSGTLELVLDRLAELTEKQQALKTKIRSALAYPILMGFVGVLVLFFLLTFIVPSITSIFEDMERALPAPTRLLLGASAFFKGYWWLFLLLLGLAAIGYQAMRKSQKGRVLIDRTILKTPGFGGLARKLAVARFSRTLGSLLENGVPMMSALGIVKNIVGNMILAQAVERATDAVGKGQGLGVSLGETGVFPALAIQMTQVGEQTGELEPMLKKVADVFEGEVETTVMNLTALLEPVMILVMGAVVGFIVLSICLPIFEMNTLIR